MRIRHDSAVIDNLRTLEFLTAVNPGGIRIFIYLFEIPVVCSFRNGC